MRAGRDRARGRSAVLLVRCRGRTAAAFGQQQESAVGHRAGPRLFVRKEASSNLLCARARQDCSDACPGAETIPELNAWQGAAAPAEDADHV
eukprot:9496813-Pyramimonas_sp.AAC.1